MTLPALLLRENQTTSAVELNSDELRIIREIAPGIRLSPALTPGAYDVTPGAIVGAIQLGERTIVIEPKVDVERLMFLLGYATDPKGWRVSHVGLTAERNLMVALIPIFLRLTEAALARGLLQGYRTQDEASTTIRGRIRFDDQMRRHGTVLLPVEIRYDDFTEDIDENRLLRAATHVLRRLPVAEEEQRRRLRALDSKLEQVSLVRYPRSRVAQPTITRLNLRYAPALHLAQLILQNASLELRHGEITSTALLFNMNRVFEDFVVVALRTALHADATHFPQGCKGRHLRMDEAQHVNLKPDLSLWRGGRCVFVGDAKYKRVSAEGIEHPDLYQLLTYTVAAQLPVGLLIYAAGEADEIEHVVVPIGKRLLVRTLDLTGTPERMLGQIQQLAQLVEELVQVSSAA